MMPLRHSFFKLFNDSMSGPRCSWTRAAFSVVEEKREKWEKHLPPHVPDKSRERERERQRRIWWEEEQCVLWHGSMLQYSIQDVANWEQMRGGDTTGTLWPGSTERQADQQMDTQSLSCILVRTWFYLFPLTYTIICKNYSYVLHLSLSFIVLVIILTCTNNNVLMGHRSGPGVKGTDHESQSARLEFGRGPLLHVILHLSLP